MCLLAKLNAPTRKNKYSFHSAFDVSLTKHFDLWLLQISGLKRH
jgi:hypothetical protein